MIVKIKFSASVWRTYDILAWNIGRVKKIFRISLIAEFFLYWLTGVCGYLSFMDKTPSRYKHTFVRGLCKEQRKIRQRKIKLSSLPPQSLSPWKVEFQSNDDSTLITITGMTFKCFGYLHSKFKDIYQQYTFYSKDKVIRKKLNTHGGKRIMDSQTCLGLYLVWLRTTSQTYILQMIFGLSSTIVSDYLNFSRCWIINCLKNDLYSNISIPDDNEIKLNKAIWANHSQA